MRGILAGIFGLAVAGAAVAEPLDGKTARGLIFSLKGSEVKLLEQALLSEQDQAILAQVGGTQFYYGAIAMSPSEGLMSNSLVAAANYHDVENARAAALEGCNARRAAGADPCAVVAELWPPAYEPRALQLSLGASEALKKDYRRGRGPKALAVSPSSGKFALAKQEDAVQAALDSCAELAQAQDCVIVVQD